MQNNKYEEIKRKFKEFQNLTPDQKVKYRCHPTMASYHVVTFHYLNLHSRSLRAFRDSRNLDSLLDLMIAEEILAEIPRTTLLEKYNITSKMKYYYKGKKWDDTKKPLNARRILEILKGASQSPLNPTQCLILAAVAANQEQTVIVLAREVGMSVASVTQHLIILTRISFVEKRDTLYYLTNEGMNELSEWTNENLASIPPPIKPPTPVKAEIPRHLDWTISTMDLKTKDEVMARNDAWIAETPEERIANNLLRNVWTGFDPSEVQDFPQYENGENSKLGSIY